MWGGKMKKIVFVLLLVLLAGCAETSLERLPEKKENVSLVKELPSEPPVLTGNVVAEVKKKDTGENNIDEIKSVIKPADRILVYPSSKVVDDGDRYLFAVGLSNNNPGRLFKARVEIVFANAFSKYSNDIYASKGEVNKWVKVNNFDLDVPAGGFAFSEVPVVVPVQAYPGIYNFYVYVYDAEKISVNDKDFYSEAGLAVTVPST
jgi:hypothetical protein